MTGGLADTLTIEVVPGATVPGAGTARLLGAGLLGLAAVRRGT